MYGIIIGIKNVYIIFRVRKTIHYEKYKYLVDSHSLMFHVRLLL